jgi:DNA-binding CsgD family transcriptional regulator
MIQVNQWLLISSIILKIHTVEDADAMRESIMKQLESLIDYKYATFYVTPHFGSMELCRPVGINITLKEMECYIKDYSHVDYSKGLMYTEKNMAYRESNIISDEERVKTKYYEIFYKNQKVHFSMHINISHMGEFLGVLSVFREVGKPDFSEDELLVFETLKDHLASRLYKEIQQNSKKKIKLKDCMKVFQLTSKELSVLESILEGYTNEEMCQHYAISYNTLKKHIVSIYKKTGCNSKLLLLREIEK